MRNGQLLVFDDTITSSVMAYTSAALHDRLGSHDELAIMAVIDNVSVANVGANVGFDLWIEHSCDTRSWLQRNDPAQSVPLTEAATTGDITFNATKPPLLTTNTTYARMFSDPCTGTSRYPTDVGGPLLTYVRFAMKLTVGSGAASAHVKVYVVQRDL